MEQIYQIEIELKEKESELYTASVEYSTLISKAAEKRVLYDVAYAQEYLKVSTDGEKRTVAATESMVLVVVQRQFTECRIAEAMADGAKRHLATLQGLLTSIQTRSKLLTTERSLLNMHI